ncbi:selenide, water dikinase SelD [endosymbiont of unidentified scaly snail isolate Monju]|uniref:selenide, water dikinase SelD n=1 Tax=endosymbiont of unidentified scaly snail isolate Monju TaxID=1248727 RepID=UPI00038920BA|nr:selenide, water dikinase SelD [endosymbiont of unidentified scaly snail isolate Monju]BAN69261.1 selenide, water dikinase [endosymbiont of unidentified scaly snail isolate Monju]
MQDSAVPVAKDLVLVGGGHAHAGVILRLGMKPVPGLRVTLITRDIHTPYSGMLPGHIAGFYDYDQCHIDLRRLCRFAGVRLYHGEVEGLDLDEHRVWLPGRPPVPWDLLSINTGSRPRQSDVAGAAEHAIPVKPVDAFLRRWQALRERVLSSDGPFRIAVVGGGAGGVELLLSVQYRLREDLAARGDDPARLHFSLFTADAELLANHAPGVRRRFVRVLAERDVDVLTDAQVVAVRADGLDLTDGRSFAADAVLWATSASTPDWPARAGLAMDAEGFIRVDDCLRSVSHSEIFAAGDVASLPDPRPKSGVFAVRQGPVLHHNLVAAARGRSLRRYRPQRHFLGLITTGDRHAIASRGPWSAEGDWLWTVKDWIDRRFMRMFDQLPAMPEPETPAPAEGLADAELRETLANLPMRCGGCGAKVGSTVLERALARLPREGGEGIVAGGPTDADDAVAFAVPPGRLLVQSVDYFRAFLDDAHVFGAIAANHALGDLYAMNAAPHSALAIATVPFGREAVIEQTLFELLDGALGVLHEAGAVLAGGHSSEGAELAFGLAVNGLADPDRLLRKGGLRPGEVLILTKPLGTGTLMAADMRHRARGRWVQGAIEQMLRSNREAAIILHGQGASACTDVTGFGLLGHLLEMLRASGCSARIDLAALPVLDGALETLAMGIQSSLAPENLRLRRAVVDLEAVRNHPRYPLLFDPQTAGGLLAGVPAGAVDDCLEYLHAAGYQAARIGEVLAGEPQVMVDQG